MSELIDSTKHTDPTTRNYRLLLASIFADRLAYYGLRGIIILYAVLELEVEKSTAFYYYGYYLIAIAVSSVLGGILSDFLSNAKTIMITGVSLCVVGGALSLISDPTALLIGMGLILLGSGFYRTASISYIGHLSYYRSKLLERRFIAGMAAINLGAFAGTLAIGLLGDEFGYGYSISAIALMYLISLVLILNLRKIESLLTNLQDSDKEKSVPVRGNIKFVILTLLGVSFIWFIYELYGYILNSPNVVYEAALFGLEIPRYLLYSTGVLFNLLLIMPYYFLAHKIPLNVKLAVGSALLGAVWLFAETSFGSGIIVLGWTPILLLGFVEGTFDLLITSSVLTFICQNTPKKYFAIVSGAYLAASILAIKLASFFSEYSQGNKMTIPVSVILIAVLTFLILVPKELKRRKMQETEPKKDSI